MGTRTVFNYDCPNCKAKEGVEVYDHPSAMMYVAHCDYCGFVEDLDYYEDDENTLVLLKKVDAKERGYLCIKCNGYIWIGERVDKICGECKENENNRD